MAALPRDLQKPRQQRASEVFTSLQLQAGQPNSQMVLFGCGLSVDATATKFDVAAGEVCLAQNLVEVPAQAAISVPAGAQTGANQACIVNVEVDNTGTAHTTAGAVASTGAAVAPALNPAYILIGQINLPANFTPGTTNLTAAMLSNTPYSAGNTSPTAGF